MNEDLDKFNPMLFADMFASLEHDISFMEAIELIVKFAILYHIENVQEEINYAEKN